MTDEWSSTSTLDPAELSLECTGQQHRLRWAGGVLTAVDHADADGERTLAALGGVPARCIQILDTWARYESDLAVLVSASRGPHDPLAPRPSHGGGRFVGMNQLRRRPRPASTGWTLYAPTPGLRRARTDDFGADLAALLTLGGGLALRLVATVIERWAERLESSERGEEVTDAIPSLQTALYGRVVPVVREWLGEPDRVTTLELAQPGAVPEIVNDDDALRLTFPFSWLRDVWTPGFATMLGELCLTATRLDNDTWQLTTLGRDLVSRHELTLRRS